MSLDGCIALACMIVVSPLDAWLLARMLRAYRKTRRGPHLWVAAGIASSWIAGLAWGLTITYDSDVARLGALAAPLRATTHLLMGTAFGMVGFFTAAAFRPRSAGARWFAAMLFVGLVGTMVGALVFEPSTDLQPVTISWVLRVPFVALAASAAAWGSWEARSLHQAFAGAAKRGKDVDPVALGRMRLFMRGSFGLFVAIVAIAGFEPHAGFLTVRGWTFIGLIIVGATSFVTACAFMWATPEWLKARWRAA